MSGARILIIEDEPHILRTVRLILAGHGYDPVPATSGEAGLEEVARRVPDAVLLDLMLPGVDGLTVIGRIRERSAVPVVVLSARGDERAKIAAFDLGADDYLTKPFGAAELLARVRVALRHSVSQSIALRFARGDLVVDFERRLVTRAGQELALTPREYDVLKFLVVNEGKVVTHRSLLAAVWGPEYAGETQYLRNIILTLRRKLERDPARPGLILTEPGIGYRVRGEEPGADAL